MVVTAAMGLPLLLRLHHGIPVYYRHTGLNIPPRRSEQYVFAAFDRLSLLRFGQFPLWAPHLDGGYEIMAYPDDYGLSPRLWLILTLGEVGAFKVDFLITQAIGAIGLYLLLRRVTGLGMAPALVAVTCFIFRAFGAIWARGDSEVTRHMFVPLVLLLLYTAGRRPWRFLGATLLLAWITADQKYSIIYAVAFMILSGVFLRVFEASPGRRGPNWRLLGLLLGAAGWAGLLLAGKLVAMIPILNWHQRSGWTAGYGLTGRAVAAWAGLMAALALAPALGRPSGHAVRSRRRRWALQVGLVLLIATAILVMPPGPLADHSTDHRRDMLRQNTEGLMVRGTLDQPLQGLTYPVFVRRFEPPGPPVGCVGFVLAGVGLVAAVRRRHWRLLVLVLFFAWITVGPVLPRDLMAATRSLPMLNLCRRPLEHFFLYRAFTLSLLAALGAGALLRVVGRAGVRWRRLAGVALVAGQLAVVAYVTVQRFAYTVSGPVPPRLPAGRFFQARGAPTWYEAAMVYANIGRLGGCTDLKNPVRLAVRPKVTYTYMPLPTTNPAWRRALRNRPAVEICVVRPNPPYRGEVYFANDDENTVTWPEWGFSPNRWTFEVDVKRPDVLVVNQLYSRWWRCDAGPVVYRRGLMAVHLGKPGRYRVHMRYVPVHFYVGCAIGAVSLVIGTAVLRLIARRRAKPADD